MATSDFTTKDLQRFWAKVALTANPDKCWIWTASLNTTGYGQFSFGGSKGKLILAHRISYELKNGEIPDGLLVLHNCPDGDNPACCNPLHLFLGTNLDNARDKVSKGRQAKGEKLSRPGESHPMHKLTDEKVIYIRNEYADGLKNKAELAREMGVNFGTITLIVNRETWRHLR